MVGIKILSALSPVLIAAIIAYLLDPLVDFFQGRVRRKSRTAGVVLTYVLLLLILAIILLAGYLKLGLRGDLVQSVTRTVSKTVNDFSDFFVQIQIQLAEWGMLDMFASLIVNISKSVSEFTESIGERLVPMAASAGNTLMNLFLGLVLAFYMLKEKNQIAEKTKELMKTLLPDRINRFLRNIAGDIDSVFSGYIRGQLTDAFIMAVLIITWLSLIRMKHAVLIGIVSGIANIIPYFGATVGVVISAVVALLNGDPAKAVTAALGVTALQQLDGMVITPRVVGKNVSMNPALILLSITVGGRLFGIPGMILGVPVCAIGKIIIGRFIERRAVLARQETDSRSSAVL